MLTIVVQLYSCLLTISFRKLAYSHDLCSFIEGRYIFRHRECNPSKQRVRGENLVVYTEKDGTKFMGLSRLNLFVCADASN